MIPLLGLQVAVQVDAKDEKENVPCPFCGASVTKQGVSIPH